MIDMRVLLVFLLSFALSSAGEKVGEKRETLLYGTVVYPDAPTSIPYPFRESVRLVKDTEALSSPEGESRLLLRRGTKVKILYPTATREGRWFYFVETEDGLHVYVPVEEVE